MALEPQRFVSRFLGELYDMLVEAKINYSAEYLRGAKAHFVHQLETNISAIRSSTMSAHASSEKKAEVKERTGVEREV